MSAAPALPLARFGKYRLVAKLAEGGMAEVYLAVEEMEQAGRRFVIVKRIRRTFESDPDYAEFFLTEGRLALKVAHPNLPQTYELGSVDGTYYLAMEFIRGPTLLDLLRAAYQRRAALSIRTTVTVSRAIAAALEHAHSLRDVDGKPLEVIHRDVTPQNVIVGYDGAVKLIDFGIAHAALQTHETAVGVVKGKFSYLAPEQIRGRGSKGIDQRADLFSLGVLMHESLAGRVLFRAGTDRETIHRILRMPIPDPRQVRPEVPPGLAEIVLKALARDPDQRYRSATELLTALEEVAESCGYDASLIKLRQEVCDLVGEPQDYKLPTISSIDPTEVELLEASSRDVTHEVPRPAQVQDAAAKPQTGAVIGDAELSYFLSQAGVVIPARRPRQATTTRTDVEFSELLATLNR